MMAKTYGTTPAMLLRLEGTPVGYAVNLETCRVGLQWEVEAVEVR